MACGTSAQTAMKAAEVQPESLPCCPCTNRGKCKSCECRRRGCTNCHNPSCHFKTDSQMKSSNVHLESNSRRFHPYAGTSNRNTGTSSANHLLAERAALENEQDDVEAQSLTISVQNMPVEELRQRVINACHSAPDLMRAFLLGPLPDQPFAPSVTPWCVCGRCQNMDDTRMNICCGYVSCLTQRPEFRNLCLRHDVIEVANILNWSHRINLPPSFTASTFRSQAYRNFVLWQHGKLGAGRRVPVPSCVCLAIRRRFPEPPGGSYRGYLSANSDSE